MVGAFTALQYSRVMPQPLFLALFNYWLQTVHTHMAKILGEQWSEQLHCSQEGSHLNVRLYGGKDHLLPFKRITSVKRVVFAAIHHWEKI